jgi:hypothetical protein
VRQINKAEILELLRQVLEQINTTGKASEREFQLAVLEALKWLLEQAKEN